jgi:gamma-glutamyltranspeptidase
LLKKDDKEPIHLHLHGAVAANGKECAAIGESILKRKGSVADAAIATMLCEGVTCKLFQVFDFRI